MKPPLFDYHRPESVPEALALLAQHADHVKVLAGGQSLMPLLNMRMARPAVLLDINRLSDLAYIRAENGFLEIGALARQSQVERSPLVRSANPLIGEALSWVGHTATRNRGTFAGSAVHNDPSSEIPTVIALLGGEMLLSSSRGDRWLSASEFFLGYMTTSLEPDELLMSVRLPVLPQGAGWAFTEVARRHGDFALVGVGTTVRLAGDGSVQQVRLALTGVADGPVCPREIGALAGHQPSAAALAEVAAEIAESLDPVSDLHATAAWRRHMARELMVQAMESAVRRAKEVG